MYYLALVIKYHALFSSIVFWWLSCCVCFKDLLIFVSCKMLSVPLDAPQAQNMMDRLSCLTEGEIILYETSGYWSVLNDSVYWTYLSINHRFVRVSMHSYVLEKFPWISQQSVALFIYFFSLAILLRLYCQNFLDTQEFNVTFTRPI